VLVAERGSSGTAKDRARLTAEIAALTRIVEDLR
jgi:hypothetical protein